MKIFKGITAMVAFAAFAMSAVVVSGSAQQVLAAECTNGSKYTDFVGSYSGRDTMTVSTKDNKKLCNDVTVNFASFTAPDNYNGQGFKGNPTALPQKQFYNKTVTLKKGTDGKTTVQVKVPECKNYQIDAYLGPVQTDITTAAGFIDTHNIVGKLFQRTKTDCTEPPVEACNTETGVVEKVAKGKENTAPHSTNMAKCKDVKVCDPATGEIITVKVAKKDDYEVSTDDACKEVRVCDPATGNVIYVKPAKKDDYKSETDEACKLSVCDPNTGNTRKVKKEDVDKYKDVDDEACQPKVKGEEAPEEIVKTGPAEAMSAILGVGSLAGAGTAYVRSRLALRK